jgi:hypothetical protein
MKIDLTNDSNKVVIQTGYKEDMNAVNVKCFTQLSVVNTMQLF